MEKFSLHPALALTERDAFSLLRRLPVLLGLMVLLGLLSAGAVRVLSAGSESSLTAAPVALVDEDNSKTSRFAVRLVAGASLADAMSLDYVSEEEAKAGLADGTYCAAIILPEGYAHAVMTGQLTSAALLLSDSMEVYTELVSAMAKAGEELLETGQLGIFAGEYVVNASDPDSHDSYLTQANLIYIAEAFASENITQLELPYSDTGVSNTLWYGVCWAVCCLLLASLFLGFLREGCSGSLLRRLTVCGAGPAAQSSVHLLTAWLFRLVCVCLVLIGLHYSGFTGQARLTVGVVLALLLISAVGNALLICLPERFTAPAIAAFASAGLLLSGGIVPRMELSQALTACGDFLPVGAASRLLATAFGAECSPRLWLAALLWTLLSLSLTAGTLVLRVRNGGDQNG